MLVYTQLTIKTMKLKYCYYFGIVYHYRLLPHSASCLSACELFATVVGIKTAPAVVAEGVTTMFANRVFVSVVV